MSESVRAGIWYTDFISVSDTIIEAPKNFRSCHEITLNNVFFLNVAETLWHCDEVTTALKNIGGRFHCLVLFYENLSARYSYIILGYIEEIKRLTQALESTAVQVTFQTENRDKRDEIRF